MNEIKLFFSQPKNTRILLLTSLLYAFVLPVVDIFVAAYIMRNSSDVGNDISANSIFGYPCHIFDKWVFVE